MEAVRHDRVETAFIFWAIRNLHSIARTRAPLRVRADFRTTYHGVRSVLIASQQKFEMLSFACAE